jgi:stage II sporulation protein D
LILTYLYYTRLTRQVNKKKEKKMKRMCIASILLLLIALLMPLLFVSADGEKRVTPPRESDAPQESDAPEYLSGLSSDGELSFTALVNGEVREFTMSDYLPGVLAGEMPALFETDALKAQAVAARTYIMYAAGRTNPNHPEAAVCDDPGCCKAYSDIDTMHSGWGENFDAYYKKISSAVSETDGEYLVYGGAPILAVFHSSSAGVTESSAAVWGDVPYLVSVDSPETESDVPGYISSVEVSAEDFKATVLEAYPDAELNGEPEYWIGEISKNESGRTSSAAVGGVEIQGTRLRTMFSMRSTAFGVSFADGRFLFSVTGYGHGVGMSQFGANVMARSGIGYKEILLHYYPGAEIVSPGR